MYGLKETRDDFHFQYAGTPIIVHKNQRDSRNWFLCLCDQHEHPQTARDDTTNYFEKGGVA